MCDPGFFGAYFTSEYFAMSDENTTVATQGDDSQAPAPTVEAADQGTQTPAEQPSSPTGDEGYDDKDAPAAPQSEVPEEKSDEQKQYDGKLRQTQAELKAEKARFKVVEDFIKKDAEVYEKALIETAGWTAEQAKQEANRVRQQAQQQQVPGQVPAPAVDPYQAAREVVAKADAERKFYQAYPDMNPTKATDDNQRLQLQALRTTAEYVASQRIQSDPSLDFVDTTIQVFGEMTRRSEEEISNAKEQGRLQGLAQNNATENATSPTTTGRQVGSAPTVNISDKEASYAKAMGMTPEEYAKYGEEETHVE